MTPKKYCLMLCLLLTATAGQAQYWFTNARDGYRYYKEYEASRTDTDRVRGLLKLAYYYQAKAGSEKTDLDSCIRLATTARDLSRRIGYTPGVQQASYWIAHAWGDGGDFRSSYALLPSLDVTTRIRVYLAMADARVEEDSLSQGAFDTLRNLTGMAARLADSIHSDYWRMAARVRVANYYEKKKDFATTKKIFAGILDTAWKKKYFGVLDEAHLYIFSAILDDSTLLHLITDFTPRAFKDFRELRDPIAIAALRPYMAQWFYRSGQMAWYLRRFQLAEDYMQQAIDIQRSGSIINYGYYEQLVVIKVYRGKPDEALRLAHEETKLVEANGNKGLESGPYWDLGYIFNNLRQENDGIEYLEKATELDKQKDELSSVENLRVYAGSATRFRKVDNALPLLVANMQKADAHNLYPLTERAMLLQALASCYEAQGKLRQAEATFLQSIDVATAAAANVERLTNSFFLGLFYYDHGQYEKARPWLHVVESDSKRAIMPLARQASTQYYLYKIDSIKGDYLSAIRHNNQWARLRDSSLTLTRKNQLEELKTKYESEKKDQAILAADKDLRASRQTRNLLIAGAVLLIALVVVLFSRYRVRQRANWLLQRVNDEQSKLIAEKEWLMKEVHHRVKNNLQLIISLLNMQKDYLTDARMLDAFGETTHRIRAISLIHQKLYGVDNMRVIKMSGYVRELIDCLESSFRGVRNIHFSVEVDEIGLDISQSVSVGLILNEAVTNAIKYAFVPGLPGRIDVSMKKQDEAILFAVADNGVGLAPDLDIDDNGSMGFGLIKILAQQLEGELQVLSEPGVRISVRFMQTPR